MIKLELIKIKLKIKKSFIENYNFLAKVNSKIYKILYLCLKNDIFFKILQIIFIKNIIINFSFILMQIYFKIV